MRGIVGSGTAASISARSSAETAMISNVGSTAARIRNDIIIGACAEGERLSEAQLCAARKVSRTPVPLALRLLEREGVIRGSEGRGHLVKSPSVDDILQAVQVRRHLESLAARLMAQSPDRAAHLPAMAEAIDTIDALIGDGGVNDEVVRRMQAARRFSSSWSTRPTLTSPRPKPAWATACAPGSGPCRCFRKRR